MLMKIFEFGFFAKKLWITRFQQSSFITNLTCLQTYPFRMVIEHHNSKVGDEAYF
jgi:hypothetical protein